MSNLSDSALICQPCGECGLAEGMGTVMLAANDHRTQSSRWGTGSWGNKPPSPGSPRNATAEREEHVRMEMHRFFCVLLIFVLLVVSGCASSPHTAGEAVSQGKQTCQVTVSSNVPSAVLLTLQGEPVGECPARFRITEQRWWNSWFSPYGQMAEISEEGDLIRSKPVVYVKGKVAAGGYYDQSFRARLGQASKIDAVKNIHVTLTPLPSTPTSSPVGITVQQQQQQQTVIMQGAGTSETAARGMVMISSTPENAEVHVDGAFVGNSPANLKLPEGIHIVEIKKMGFRPYRKELRVIGSSELNLRVTLEKE